MLNSLINLNNDNEPHYAIYFKGVNKCIHCGEECCLELIDIYGNKQQATDIYPYKEIVCNKCHSRFSIQWEIDENNEVAYYAIGNYIKKDFVKEIENGAK